MDKNNDCYFYFYSTCTKENNCPFRHCDLALGSEVVCELWRIGRCKDRNCPFRHMEPNINRSTIPCWFETQPMGCRKPHCVFMHTKPRPSINELQNKSSEWILPTGNTSIAGLNKVNSQQLTNELVSQTNKEIQSTQISEQIHISIDKDEESDDQENNETNTSNPEKNEPAVKTLEQIKMEKILNSPIEHLIDTTNNHHMNNNINNKINPTKIDMKFDMKTNPNKLISKSLIKLQDFTEEKPIKEKEPVNFVVKTLEQIRKEREESEQKNSDHQENETTLKENKMPNLLKRSNEDLKQCTKPIKIRRNRVSIILHHDSNSVRENDNHIKKNKYTEESNNEATQNKEKILADNQRNISDLDLGFLNDISTVNDSHQFENKDNVELDIDDDELMREIDQVINS